MPESDNILALCHLSQKVRVREYSEKYMVIFKEVKPILLEPGRFKAPYPYRIKKILQMRFLLALNFRL